LPSMTATGSRRSAYPLTDPASEEVSRSRRGIGRSKTRLLPTVCEAS
jgi:hypothetical protein